MTIFNAANPPGPEFDRERRHALWESDLFELDRAIEDLRQIRRAERKAQRRLRIERLLTVGRPHHRTDVVETP